MIKTIAKKFREFGIFYCCKCNAIATGVIISNRNTEMGPHCKSCAEKEIKKANLIEEKQT